MFALNTNTAGSYTTQGQQPPATTIDYTFQHSDRVGEAFDFSMASTTCTVPSDTVDPDCTQTDPGQQVQHLSLSRLSSCA